METLRMGPAAIQEMGQSMGVWGDDTIANLAAASDEIKTFQNTMTIAFGTVAQVVNPLIKVFHALVEEMTLLAAAAFELAKGNLAAARQLVKTASEAGMSIEADKNKKAEERKPVDLEGGISGKKATQKAAKEAEKAEKEAIKERTELAMHNLKQEEIEKKLAADSEERRREILFESEREAIKQKIDNAMEENKLLEKQKDQIAGPGVNSRQFSQAQGQAAGQRLDIAAGLGGGVAAEVEKARAKAAAEQQKIAQKRFDEEVMANTSATTVGMGGLSSSRDMKSRRQEYIQTQATKEAEGKTTLDDINKTLQDALAKLTSAPLVT
jgi:hypothetical protein